MGKPTDEWVVGDVEAALKPADLVLDETFVSQSTGHQPLETALGDGLLAERQALHARLDAEHRADGRRRSRVASASSPNEVVLISEYTGGGFGSKIPGAISMAIPALLSKKANAPVMMRITREEEHYIGRARPGLHSRVKVGFRKDGKIIAIDGFADRRQRSVRRAGRRPLGRPARSRSAISRRRCGGAALTVLTNTPPKTSQRAPGGMQGNGLMEPVSPRPPTSSGIDQVEIRQINAPAGKAPFGPPAAADSGRRTSPSAFVKEALDKGAELFNWEEKKARSGKRVGTKVRGSGVAVSAYTGGSIGFDGLFIIKPDGKVQFQSGIGNLGTHSVIDVHRVAAEMLGVPWEQCEVVLGNTAQEPAVDLHLGRQPDDARDDARGARGRRPTRSRSCRRSRRRRSAAVRRATRWRTAACRRRPQHDVRAGRRRRRSSSAASTTATSCRTTSTPSRSGRSPALAGQGLMAVGARQLSARRRRRSRTSSASPKSKSTSRPASTRSSSSRRSPTSAP